jgi:nucleotide-binding universal stress UspA family protein
MDWKRIVVGVDFSPESEIAVEQALAVARRTGAELLMLHASEVVELDADPESREMFAVEQRDSRERLAELRERHAGAGAVISHALVEGKPAAAIADAADEIGAALVVVGTHGRTGFRRFLLGSVAERVVKRCEADVLVARSSARPGVYRRILVATDFSDPAKRALQIAVAIADDGAEIDLVHFWQLPVPITSHYTPLAGRSEVTQRVAREFEAAARERAEHQAERFRDDRVGIDVAVSPGPAAMGIVDRAAGYDLVALGRRGMSGFERFLVGSVADKVVRHAPCSVLVSHTPPD